MSEDPSFWSGSLLSYFLHSAWNLYVKAWPKLQIGHIHPLWGTVLEQNVFMVEMGYAYHNLGSDANHWALFTPVLNCPLTYD